MMSVVEAVQTTAQPRNSNATGFLLQRKCACGGSSGLSGECEECKRKKLLGKPLQRKLAINEPGGEDDRTIAVFAGLVGYFGGPGDENDWEKYAANAASRTRSKLNPTPPGPPPATGIP
jgi:hypothetical protein